MDFSVLGTLQVRDGDRPIDVSAPKQRALLALLLVNAGRVLPVELILESLWPDGALNRGHKNVHFHVSRLRSALEPGVRGAGFKVIRWDRAGYLIDPEEHVLDAREFEVLVAAARRDIGPRPGRAHRRLCAALDLWRGDPYMDVRYEDFAATEIRRLEALRRDAMEDRIALELRLGRSDDLTYELEHLVEADPLRERTRLLLMRAMYAAGRQADAIAEGSRYRDQLVEVGLEPSPRLSHLEDQILSHRTGLDPRIQRSESGAMRSLPPEELSSFIGRANELKEVTTLARDTRLVTLVGPPGAGKTRLALQVARRIAAEFPDGAVFVELSEVRDSDLVPHAVGTAVGIPDAWSNHYTTRLLSSLRGAHALLLLDNCEHVLNGAARLVLTVLQGCPGITVLATSREALGIPGERAWTVPSFAVPEIGQWDVDELLAVDSVRLFVDRASDAGPTFTLDDDNKGAVADLCRRLDGLPLAIELAASAAAALGPRRLVSRLATRFTALPSAPRPGLPRQETMNAAVRWSFDLLDRTDRAVFSRLSVFAGGMTMDGAEHVAGWGEVERQAVFDSVLRLVHKSLLNAEPEGPLGVRYRMMMPLRQFGQQMLAASGNGVAVDRRHAEYFAAKAESLAPHLEGPDQEDARSVADLDGENFRSALAWSLTSGEIGPAARIATSLTWYWYGRSYLTEGYQLTERTVAAVPFEWTSTRARLLYAAGVFGSAVGRFDAARDRLGEALHISRDLGLDGLEARALTGLGGVARDSGAFREAISHLEAAEAIDRGRGEQLHLAATLRMLGVCRFLMGRMAAGRAALEESYDLFERLGDDGGMAYALADLARVALRLGEPEGMTQIGRALELFHRIDDRRGAAWAGYRMALALVNQGRVSEARELIEQSQMAFADQGDRRGSAYAMVCSGLVALDKGDIDRAAADLRQSLRLFVEIGDAHGRSSAHAGLVHLAICEDNLAAARRNARQSLDLAEEIGYVWGALNTLEGAIRGVTQQGGDPGAIVVLRDAYLAALRADDEAAAAAVPLRTLPDLLLPRTAPYR